MGKTRGNKQGKSSTDTRNCDSLVLSATVFFLTLKNSAFVFSLAPGFDYFAVQGLFSSFLACLMTSITSER